MLRPLALAVLLAALVAPSASADDWTRFGGDNQVTNDVPAATADAFDVDTAHVAALDQRWRVDLDGPVVAQPLYLAGIEGDISTVYVATESGSVYALRASDGGVIWHRTFPTFTINEDDCSTYGVSSTGVIDRARGLLYVADADGMIHALDLNTGAEAPGFPVTLPIDTLTGYVWGGLTLVGDTLYAPVSSYCDTPDPATGLFATGGLVAVDVSAARVTGSFTVSPPGTLGGIWGYGGASVDPLTGDLWVATGNSEPLGAGEAQGYAESVVQLDAQLGVLAWNRPPGIPTADLDTDFGSTPLLFQPDGCPPLAAAYNKNGELYVWNRDNLGGGPIWSDETGPDNLATPFIGEPSWSADLQELVVANARVYDPDVLGGVTHFDAAVAFKVGAGCTFPNSATWIADAGQGTKPPALIAGGLVFVAGGNSTTFTVLDAATGTSLRTFELENVMYASPTLAGDEVIVANGAGTVFAIGPQAPPPKPAFLHVRRAAPFRVS